MRAVQITRFGGPEVLEIVDVSTAGLNVADTHHSLSAN